MRTLVLLLAFTALITAQSKVTINPFPPGSGLQLTPTSNSGGGITGVTPGSGLAGGGTSGNVTVSCVQATTSTPGCVKPDGTTITAAAGVISAVNPITGLTPNALTVANSGGNGVVTVQNLVTTTPSGLASAISGGGVHAIVTASGAPASTISVPSNTTIDCLPGVVITQSTPNTNLFTIAGGSTGITFQNCIFAGGGIFNTNSGGTSNLIIQGVTISGITSASFPYNEAFYSTTPISSSAIINSHFNNVASGFYINTAHSLKLDKLFFNGVGLSSLPSDAIYLNSLGTTITDPNTSNDVSITNISCTNLYRMCVEVQGTYADTVRVLNVDASGWNASSSASLSFGISIDVNNAGVGAAAEVASSKLTGGGASASNTQIGIEMASPNINVHDNEVTGWQDGIQLDNALNGHCSITSNILTSNGTSVNFSQDGDGCTVINNQVREPVGLPFYVQAGTGGNARFIGNTIRRTPVSTDSGTLYMFAIGSGSYPQTFANNTIEILSGTIPAGAYYVAFGHHSNISGTLFTNNNILNYNSGSSAAVFGYECSGSTGFDGSTIQFGTMLNIGTPLNCGSGTLVKYGNNLATGNTPASLLTNGSNIIGAQTFFGTAAPGSVTGNLPGDLYYNGSTAAYWCAAAAGTAPPACTSVTSGGWTIFGSSGGSPVTSATGGSGTGTVTCASAACTNLRGNYTVGGGTFATGTLLTLVWPTTTNAYVCIANVLNNATGASIGYHSIATATGMTFSSLTAATGLTVAIDYSCQP